MFRRVSHRAVFLLISVAVLGAVLASPAFGVVRFAPELRPDGLARAVIVGAEVKAPGPHNELLEADLVVDVDTDLGIRNYQYRWNRGTYGAIQTTDVVTPTVSYAATIPDTRYALQVRAVDRYGWASDWYTAWTGITPSAPNIVVAGDSIASGYTRQWFLGSATCRDNDYSYGHTIRDDLAASLPSAWAPTYRNVAWPGAGVGDMLNGGKDSCSTEHPSQIDEIVASTAPDTWNIVVVTAGINSTNWGDVIIDLTRQTAFSLTDAGDKQKCVEAVTGKWNLASKRDGITGMTSDIVTALEDSTNAKIFWTSYFAIDGTRFAPGWTPIGHECADEMTTALSELHGSIRDGLDDEVTWVDIEHAGVTTQMWAGWPHPNPNGHAVIGNEVAAAIVG
jgi:GDSL-like Lipase/Acylhydrolase